MGRKISILIGISLLLGSSVVIAGIDQDIEKFQGYFLKKFPGKSLQDFQDGPYVFNEDKHQQFEAVMEFPPFEDLVEKGKTLWNKPFKNGQTFASCFGTNEAKIRPQYPKWDAKKGEVITLERALKSCLKKNNEADLKKANGKPKWGWKKGNIAYVSAYLTTAADGEKINVIVPKDDAKAVAAYEDGKRFFYAKRGQLNLSCANCHIDSAGQRIRGNVLSAALGQITHFPVWRGKWAKKKGDGFGTIQRRFGGCNKQVRAKPFKAQKSEYNNLEYFLTAMSNGLTFNGTSYRE